MTTKTIQECIPPAKRAYNRAFAKVSICHKQRSINDCENCSRMNICDLVTTFNQMLTNLNEINRKANDLNQKDPDIH